MLLEKVFSKVYKAWEVRHQNLTLHCFSMPLCNLKGKNKMSASFGIKYVRLKNVGFYFIVNITRNNYKCIIYLKWAGIEHGIEIDWLTDWLIGQWLFVTFLVHSYPVREPPSRLETLWMTTFALCRMLYIELHLLVPFQHPQSWIPKDQGMRWHWILRNRQQLCRQPGLNHCTVPVCKAKEKRDWQLGHK